MLAGAGLTSPEWAGKRLKVYAAPGWGGKLVLDASLLFKFGYLRNVYLCETFTR